MKGQKQMKTKKLLAVILTLALVLSLSLAAFADNASEQKAFQDAEGIKKPADLTDHTYTAYQIFTGTQSEDDDDATLGAIDWGTGVNGPALLAALQGSDAFVDGTSGDNLFKDCTDAAGVAAVIGEWADSSAQAKAFAKLAYANKKGDGTAVENNQTNLDAGYYLVVDTTSSVPAGTGDDVYNLSLLQLTKKGTFAITVKVEVPSIVKTIANNLICGFVVDDQNRVLNTDPATKDAKPYLDASGKPTDVAADAATHTHAASCYNLEANQMAVGDTVNFKLEGTVPATASNYNYYYFVLTDTLGEGLTLKPEEGSYVNIHVFADGEELTRVPAAGVSGEDDDYYKLELGSTGDDFTFKVGLMDAIAHKGETITVTYDAVLNEEAVIGEAGNPNEATITYSKDPNSTKEGTPGIPDDDDEVPLGETPKDITKSYTTGIILYKEDGTAKPLTGAEFKIEGETINKVITTREVYVAFTTGATESEYTYWKLKDGKYTETAPVANRMEPAAAGATSGWVVLTDGEGWTGETKVADGITYRPYNATTDAGKDIYVLAAGTEDDYVSTTLKYKKTTVTDVVEKSASVSVQKFVGDDGALLLEGLGEGTYTITETTVPAGYNPIDPITVTISCDLPDEIVDGTEECEWSGTYKIGDENPTAITFDDTKGVLPVTIVNQKGNVLPETGGIGTTIFYVVGGVLVAAAGILLVTKKRMNNAE